MAGSISVLETDRVEAFTTSAELPPAFCRTEPVTVTRPVGGGGTCEGEVSPWFDVATHPRSTRSAVPESVTSGTTTSTPALPSRVWYRTITVFEGS